MRKAAEEVSTRPSQARCSLCHFYVSTRRVVHVACRMAAPCDPVAPRAAGEMASSDFLAPICSKEHDHICRICIYIPSYLLSAAHCVRTSAHSRHSGLGRPDLRSERLRLVGLGGGLHRGCAPALPTSATGTGLAKCRHLHRDWARPLPLSAIGGSGWQKGAKGFGDCPSVPCRYIACCASPVRPSPL